MEKDVSQTDEHSNKEFMFSINWLESNAYITITYFKQ